MRSVHRALIAPIVVAIGLCTAALAETEARIEHFMQVTGFDVALESIRLTADSAPGIIGLSSDAFGTRWQSEAAEVFEVDAMHAEAVAMLAQTIEPELLDHAIAFYSSDLGKRLVAAENAAHMKEDEDLKRESGEAIIAGLVRLGSPRLSELKRLMSATGSADASVHAIQEIQVRFMLAAAVAGVIDLRMDEADLRAAIAQQEGALRRSIQTSGLASTAYSYQAFSDDEIAAYADALEDDRMQRIYALMNAVQFQIMADRFEAMALRMEDMRPSQEL